MANLPVPVLASEVAGNWVTAALWRANVYNASTFQLNPPLFVGTQSTSQSINSNSWTAISLNTEQVDTYGGHSTSTNNSRYVAQVPGWYSVCGVVCWTANGTSFRGSRIHVNGASVQGSAQMTQFSASGSTTGVATAVRSVQLAAGDYVEVAGYQLTGAALSTTINLESASALWVCWAHA